ncbi:MAG: urea ABC transporter ATP-binding subunit UrtE [Verrucomicrobia bacterium]|nr:urea ABC transporter ATP-binding subunit UrtE [Verrucomicrobiota bacterium]
MSTLLHLQSVEADISGSRILRGVELKVRPGEVVALMGRNGVGKTTTLKTITGLLPVSTGAIIFEGKPIHGLATDVRARLGIGYVPQGRDIFPHMTVEENLRIGLVVHGRKGAEAASALERVYQLFPVLKEMLGRKGGVLSGGQQQQLAIGRALLCDPKLLILDEPTEGIQPSIIEQIGDTLRLLRTIPRSDGTSLAILLVEQYVDFCRSVAARYYALDRGAVVSSGTIADLTDEVVRIHLQV